MSMAFAFDLVLVVSCWYRKKRSGLRITYVFRLSSAHVEAFAAVPSCCLDFDMIPWRPVKPTLSLIIAEVDELTRHFSIADVIGYIRDLATVVIRKISEVLERSRIPS
jgi:hypothetical protein